MKLLPWSKIPDKFRNDEVYDYYRILEKKTTQLFLKRVFDIFLSAILIVILFPLMIFLSIIIKLDSIGPIFFRQYRITQYGKSFKIFKFRTMCVDNNKAGSQITLKNDYRITGVGKIIRKIRLDEVPQLFNIFIGDMSFVGARPEVPKYVDDYDKEMLATLLLPAGLTSKASICYKNEEDILLSSSNIDSDYVTKILPQKMIYNLEYIENVSLLHDIKIMFMTVIGVIKQ